MQNYYVGQQIDRYRITERLGLGGMAVVYKAYDTRLERDIALKLIRTESIPQDQHERLFKRFEREAKAQAKFSHPNIIPVYDYGKIEDVPYLVLQFLPGRTLKERLKRPFSLDESLSILIPISDAVAYAHSRNVIHRDIKPSNIIFNEEDQPLLTDFGIAKVLESNVGTLTGTGLGVGTPEYMAPEQWQGKATEASDQYALGVLLYEMLTGSKPFTAETPVAVALKQINEPLKRPTELVLDISLPIENFIFKAMARDPQDRFASVSDFRDKLESISAQYLPKTNLPDGNEEPSFEELVEKSTFDNKSNKPPRKGYFPKSNGEFSESDEVDTEDALNSTNVHQKPDPSPLKIKKRGKTSNKMIKWLGGGLIGLIVISFALVLGDNLLSIKNNNENTSLLKNQETPAFTEMTLKTATMTIRPSPTATLSVTPEPSATPTAQIITRVRETDGMVQVFVPGGEVKLGYTSEELDELMQICSDPNNIFSCGFLEYYNSEISFSNLDDFWIDQTEVTNRMYEACRLSGACPPVIKSSYTRQVYSRDPQYADFPMMYTYWDEVNAYCKWVGGRLPTFAEWKMAATGTDGRFFPWGNDPPSTSLMNYSQSGIGDSVAVGSYPEGMSPYGALDLLGNVSEWLGDCITPDGHNEELCGWYIGGNAVDETFIDLFFPSYGGAGSSGQGFRCVMDGDLEN